MHPAKMHAIIGFLLFILSSIDTVNAGFWAKNVESSNAVDLASHGTTAAAAFPSAVSTVASFSHTDDDALAMAIPDFQYSTFADSIIPPAVNSMIAAGTSLTALVKEICHDTILKDCDKQLFPGILQSCGYINGQPTRLAADEHKGWTTGEVKEIHAARLALCDWKSAGPAELPPACAALTWIDPCKNIEVDLTDIIGIKDISKSDLGQCKAYIREVGGLWVSYNRGGTRVQQICDSPHIATSPTVLQHTLLRNTGLWNKALVMMHNATNALLGHVSQHIVAINEMFRDASDSMKTLLGQLTGGLVEFQHEQRAIIKQHSEQIVGDLRSGAKGVAEMLGALVKLTNQATSNVTSLSLQVPAVSDGLAALKGGVEDAHVRMDGLVARFEHLDVVAERTEDTLVALRHEVLDLKDGVEQFNVRLQETDAMLDKINVSLVRVEKLIGQVYDLLKWPIALVSGINSMVASLSSRYTLLVLVVVGVFWSCWQWRSRVMAVIPGLKGMFGGAVRDTERALDNTPGTS